MSKSNSFLAVYQKGILLSEAVVHFAPKNLRDEYLAAYEHDNARGEAALRARAQELRSSPNDAATKRSIAQNLQIDLEKLETDPSYMRVLPDDGRLLSTQSKHHTEYVPPMQNSLLESIRAGRFAALGYQAQNNVNDSPVRIPDDILRSPSWIDWPNSTIVSNGMTFVAVRLVLMELLNCTGKTESRMGAPSKERICVDAYKDAHGNDKINPTDSKKTVIAAVSKIVGPSITLKTIWKHVGPIHLANQQREESGRK